MPMNENGASAQQLPEEMVLAARALARRLICRMVVGGATISDVKKSHTGMCGPGYSASVGGWMDGKSYSTDFIIVASVEGQEVNLVFKTRDIIRDIDAELKTASALDNFKLEPG